MHAASTLALALLLPGAQPPADSAPVNVKECVAKGLKWLGEQQEPEGNWFGRANSAPVTTTAMAGLALLMEGSTLKTGTYAPNLRQAVAWMEKSAAANGSLVGTNPTDLARTITTHATATLFLASAYDVDDDAARRERLRRILERATAYTADAQTARGGWAMTQTRNRPVRDDALTTVTVLHALLTVRTVGIDVPRQTVNKAIDYLVKSTASSGAVFVFGSNDAVPTAQVAHQTAGAAATLLMHDGARPEALIRWLRNLHTLTLPMWPVSANAAAMATQLNLARLTFALGENGHRALERDTTVGDPITWSGYRARTFRWIKAAQAPDGSWPNTQPGPVYGSAVALIILQMENDYLPAFSR
jgi:hypothetical protein